MMKTMPVMAFREIIPGICRFFFQVAKEDIKDQQTSPVLLPAADSGSWLSCPVISGLIEYQYPNNTCQPDKLGSMFPQQPICAS
jgi:hypothetical protein